jgi:catechol 2,3-dioxygenase-like lactoylglutathione lyase family enzyme
VTSDERISPARVSHLGICVNDLEQSIRFYSDGLGFTPQLAWRRSEGAVTGDPLGVDGDVRGQYLELDGTTIELLWFVSSGAPTATPRPMNQLGLTHVTVLVDDLDATLDRLAACGGNDPRIDPRRLRPAARLGLADVLHRSRWHAPGDQPADVARCR